MIAFLNGEFVPLEQAVVPVMDRSFRYGDGVFETIPVYQGKPFRWAQHLERLARGAVFLKIRQPYAPKQLRAFMGELIEKNAMPNSVVRLVLSRGAGERGYSPAGADSPLVAMTLHPLPQTDPENPPRWGLKTSSYRLLASDPLCTFKTNSKLLHVMARAEAEADGVEEALLLNTNGEVAEASSANIFWIYRDIVFTPPTGRGALPGITRAVILELCQVLNLPTNKRVIKPESLARSEGIFLSLSASGIIPVHSLDGEPVPSSPVVDRIIAAYYEAVRRETG